MADEIVGFVKELGDAIYIQSPVSLLRPDPVEIESFAFAEDLKRMAPNPNILWLGGRYVEADRANANGDQWTAGEVAVKSLTPTFMPVTVMHDMRSAVGTIVETKLRLPAKEADVSRARLDTTLAVWAHRFPQIAEEAETNAKQGTLMQSMECKSPSYECSVCARLYQVEPGRTERESWCSHLKGEVDDTGEARAGARILRSVVFSGTGLIFGTRGAKGAYTEAHLEVEALAEFHAKSRRDSGNGPGDRSYITSSRQGKSPKSRRTGVMEIEDRDYQALVAAKTTAESKVETLETQISEKDSQIEAAEAAKVKAEDEAGKEKLRADEAEEKARVADLREERLEKLGGGFTAKLAKLEATHKRVLAQAGTLKDEAWEERIAELEETLDVKRDEPVAAAEGDEAKIKKLVGEGKTRAEAEQILKKSSTSTAGADDDGDDTAGLLFSRQDASGVDLTASAGDGHKAPSKEARHSVVSGLISRPRRTTATTGADK